MTDGDYYATYTQVRYKTGLTTSEVNDTVLDDMLAQANEETNRLTGRKWDDANSITELYPSIKKDLLDRASVSLILNNRPIQSITEFLFLNSDGSTTDTLDTLTTSEVTAGTFNSDDYWITPSTGEIRLTSTEFPNSDGDQIKISYTYGFSSVPENIRMLTACFAGIRSWLYFLGGNYNRYNSYQVPGDTKNKGDFYQRGKDMIELLKNEANDLLKDIGKRSTIRFASTSRALKG